MKKVYYAHSCLKYNTEVEKYEMSLIPKHMEIVNPNGAAPQDIPEPEIMKKCFELIDECDCVMFSSLDGVIGKGVADEIEYAYQTGKPVFYLFHNGVHSCRDVIIRPIAGSETPRIYATFEWIPDIGPCLFMDEGVAFGNAKLREKVDNLFVQANDIYPWLSDYCACTDDEKKVVDALGSFIDKYDEAFGITGSRAQELADKIVQYIEEFCGNDKPEGLSDDLCGLTQYLEGLVGKASVKSVLVETIGFTEREIRAAGY